MFPTFLNNFFFILYTKRGSMPCQDVRFTKITSTQKDARYFGGEGGTRVLRTPFCGARKNVRAQVRTSIFSTAATKSRSLHPPPAAVALFARTFGARVRDPIYTKITSTPKDARYFGGEGGTRTLAPGFSRPTPLAGAPRHQLEYFSISDVTLHYMIRLHGSLPWRRR